MPSEFETLCQRVKPRNIHKDEKSLENTTGKIKRKFKLTGKPLTALGQFIFFILTRNPEVYHKSLTIRVEKDEWENKNPKYQNSLGETSYIDITRFEILTKNELISKIFDKYNGFKYIAKLPANKFIELDNKRYSNNRSLKKLVSSEIEKILKEALHDEILINLGI